MVVRLCGIGTGFAPVVEGAMAGLAVAAEGFGRGTLPWRSGDQTRQALQHQAQDRLVGTGAGQMQHHPGLQFDDAGGELHQAQAERVELRHAPGRALWHHAAQRPHEPIGAEVQEQAQLVGRGTGAGRAIGGEVPFPGFDVVLRLSPLAGPS